MTVGGDFYRIRPSARLISAIGEDIIKDVHAAIVELVKNAYDADAKKVSIQFSSFKSMDTNADGLMIVIKDDGHGMSHDDVVNKWMVPATDDKLKRRYSPSGRLMQGRKGIGRYAAAILGDVMALETVDLKGQKTSLRIDWKKIAKQVYLENVKIYITSEQSTEPAGTCFTITGNSQKLKEWTKDEIEKLIRELRKLVSPIINDSEDFRISLSFSNFPLDAYKDRKINIEPFPMLELFDYRLSGEVSENGHAVLKYENNSIPGIEKPEDIILDIHLDGVTADYCGPVKLDLRVFDRDPDSIQNLINKGVKDPETGKYLGKLETRKLLDEICGIAIYRKNFRIRPYGDPAFDWLRLDELRVQDPSYKIGRNQVSGFVIIEQEEISHLEEKSARDGLKETKYYEGLRKIVWIALNQIENRRYAFRKRIGKGRKKVRIEKELDNLINFSTMSREIENTIANLNVSKENIEQVKSIIIKTQEEKAKEIEKIRNEFAIYQGQVTLGKIIMVLLHEGRKPLAWFKDQAEYMPQFAEKLKKKFDKDILERIIERTANYKVQSDILIRLFNKIEPLAIKKRSRKKKLDIRKTILTAAQVFEGEMDRNNIKFSLDCPDNIYLMGWEEDFYTALTNLFENSIYWLSNSRNKSKEIKILVFFDEQNLTIDFIDNGPGIDKQLLKDDILFDPGITSKPPGEGSGLGLAIAGEAVERNNGKLKALSYDNGAYFRMEFNFISSEVR